MQILHLKHLIFSYLCTMELFLQVLQYVRKCASPYGGLFFRYSDGRVHRIPMEDLMGEIYIPFLKAVRTYDDSKGCKVVPWCYRVIWRELWDQCKANAYRTVVDTESPLFCNAFSEVNHEERFVRRWRGRRATIANVVVSNKGTLRSAAKRLGMTREDLSAELRRMIKEYADDECSFL